MALHITLTKDNWKFSRLSGLLIMKRKKGNQWAHYLAAKVDEKGKKYKHYYLEWHPRKPPTPRRKLKTKVKIS